MRRRPSRAAASLAPLGPPGLWAAVLTVALVAPTAARADFIDALKAWLFGAGEAPRVEETPPPAGTSPNLFEALPTIGFAAPLSVRVGEGVGEVKVTLVRRGTTHGTAAVDVTAIGASAVAGEDFEPVTRTVTFPDGKSEIVVAVRVLDDSRHEPSESFGIELSAPREASLDAAASTVEVVIDDDDPEPPTGRARLSLSPSDLALGEIEVGGEKSGTVLMRNAGSVAAHLGIAAVTEGAGSFRALSDSCSGAELAPGKSCKVVYSFRAAEPGAHRGRVVLPYDWGAGAAAGRDSVAVGLSGSVVAPPPPPDPMAAVIAEARERRLASRATGQSVVPVPPAPAPKDHYRMEDKDYESIGLEKSFFTYPVYRERIITVDQTIPCVLSVSINSQIPGRNVPCQVEENVYGMDGRRVLIPSGTKVLGDYESLSKLGDTRLNIIWKRFLRPDGASIVISGGFQGGDAMGRTGIPGVVDTKIFERYAGPVLLTTLSALSAYAVPENSTQLAEAQAQLAEGLGQVTQQMLDENLDLRPVVSIPAGARMTIRPLVDLFFRTPERLEPLAPPTAASRLAGPKGVGGADKKK